MKNINYDNMHQQWDKLFDGDLPDNQMVKLTYNYYATEYGNKILKTATPEVQIRTKQDITDFFQGKLIDPKYGNPIKPLGGSINAGVYKFDKLQPYKKCSSANFLGTKSIMIDLDAYVPPGNLEMMSSQPNKDTSTFERLSLATLTNDDYGIHGAMVETELSVDMGVAFGDICKSSDVIATGGGLSIMYNFSRRLNLDETKKAYTIIKDVMMRKFDDLGPKKKLRSDFIDKDGDRYFKCQTSEGSHKFIYYKLDKSAFSVFQTQRISGSARPNYDGFVTYPIDTSSIVQTVASSDHKLKGLANTLLKFDKANKIHNGGTLLDFDESELARKYNGEQRIVPGGDNTTSIHLALAGIPKIDKELSSIILNGNPLNILENILELTVESSNDQFAKFLDPIREENHASISLKYSDGKLIISDFYDNKYYGFMEYIVHIKKQLERSNYTMADALDEIATYIPTIKTDDKLEKSINDMYEQGAISEIIDHLNGETEYIYYVNAANKRLVYRMNILTGDVASFDGIPIFVDTMLRNKLKLPAEDIDFNKKLYQSLQTQVIKLGHERYEPGGEPWFFDDGLLYINTWISTEVYREVEENIKGLREATATFNAENPSNKRSASFGIMTSLDMIAKETPMSFMLLNQITQEGSLPWITKWLAAIANFEVVPTLPVLFGEYGSGKNIFLERMIAPYFGGSNIEAIQADRLASGFNSVLGNKNIIALDEGDVGARGIYETIKALTGSDTIMIEKKGVDASAEKRHANFMLFNNSQIPLQHEASDRRAVYFKLKETLRQTLHSIGMDFSEFSKKLKAEQTTLWTIIKNTDYHNDDVFSSLHDAGYYRQILLMHPFGQLLVAMIENRLNQIFLDTLGQETQRAQYTEKTERLKEIANLFHNNEPIPLLSINNYTRMAVAVNPSFKRAGSLSQFVYTNGLDKIGITINDNMKTSDEAGGEDEMFTISINKDKIIQAISPTNNLYSWNNDYFGNGRISSFGASSHGELDYQYKPLGHKTANQYLQEAQVQLTAELGNEFDLMKPAPKKKLVDLRIAMIKEQEAFDKIEDSETEVFSSELD